MKLPCYKCDEIMEVSIEISGPHLKASCIECSSYIKFLNTNEKKLLEEEEDKGD